MPGGYIQHSDASRVILYVSIYVDPLVLVIIYIPNFVAWIPQSNISRFMDEIIIPRWPRKAQCFIPLRITRELKDLQVTYHGLKQGLPAGLETWKSSAVLVHQPLNSMNIPFFITFSNHGFLAMKSPCSSPRITGTFVETMSQQAWGEVIAVRPTNWSKKNMGFVLWGLMMGIYFFLDIYICKLIYVYI